MGNSLCMEQKVEKNQQKTKKSGLQSSNNDLNEYKLPADPKEKKLFQSQAGNHSLGEEEKITLSSFRIIRVIGSGAFGKVYLVNKKGTEEVYAMKVYDKMTLYEKNVILSTIGERNILKNMNSNFIVKLHYAFQAAQNLYLMMDFMVGGELYYHLKKAKKFDEERTKFYIAQVILAIECLHQNNIMYRDLKLENILLGQDGYIKLTDFGLSKEGIKDKDLTNTLCGTAEYMAPEQIMNEGHNKMADFWQIGVLTYEMLYGTTPFFNEFRPNKDEIFNDIIQGKYTFPQYFKDDAKNFIRGLLQKDVKKRLGYNGFHELKKHAFFADFDWDKLERQEIEPQFKPPLRSQVDLQNFNPRLVKNTMTDLGVKDNKPHLKEEIESQFRGFTFVKEYLNFLQLYLTLIQNFNSDHLNTDVPQRNSSAERNN
ncbi:Serine/Threonine kinase domain protein (macronuclear) [Tetrahymena thermophila SB210]|uniref:Serine/Threonine kinase domain protein n=1 Tax=Tetrahymena thermophila (strain SB210) TaxID=312017 RepID=I7MM38_TETTS|nr:Serine/Threonine kinase domain protein [Tetrahymena thermophila SB210]EAS03904.3 Serine/Threonine kinase domain protein [Tetrahymena thermophila SB210]|eukprot:XP_001024149.3 Serine/Threonine kinase domain protein [Tetrahymena thermophila SB210]